LKSRRALVERKTTAPSLRRQCELLRVSRSALAYAPVAPDEEELGLMRRIDELHLKFPFYGSRNLSFTLRSEGRQANRKRVQRLMRVMGLESMAPKPKTSEPHPEHVKYPYLLRGLHISRANQVWATDITYIPMRAGFVYLVCIMDWFSRLVLSWRLSTTMDTDFCVEALEESLQRFGSPDIFNTDQGAQFTSDAFTGVLKRRGVAISMDGKGRFLDNIFVERLWRSLKWEEVYLHAYEDPKEARAGIGRYLDFYNGDRPHQALGYQTPKAFYEHDVARRLGPLKPIARRSDTCGKTDGASRQAASQARSFKAA
jgi:putative transposase